MRKLALLTVVLWATLLLSGHAQASQVQNAPSVADLDRLARDPTWLKLVHYRDRLSGSGGSDVLSPTFFLAADGARNPRAELAATIAGLMEPAVGRPDDTVRCRFPARTRWLSQQLGWPRPASAPCPAYDTWRGAEPITGASLIFASGYLKNPASYYGHILLKLNTSGAVGRSDLTESVMNFGASYPPNENGLVYVVKGLGGGYLASYSHLPFYNHQFNYAESELRDVWEYELELDAEQIALLSDHVWEVSGTANRYYFLRQNCAYRLAELVNLVVDAPLIPPDKPWTMPIDVFERLMRDRPGKPLVRSVVRIDSRQNAFRRAYFALPAQAQRDIVAYVEGSSVAPDRELARQAPVLDALIDYYSFLVAASEKAQREPGVLADMKARRNALLLARLHLPVATAGTPPAPKDLPNEGQKSSLLQASYVSNTEIGDGLELRVRPAYHDFLTYAPGVVAGSELAFADTRLDIRDGKVRLRGLDLVKVVALNLSPTGLVRDGAPAWAIRFGVEDRALGCQDCLVGFVEGGYGRAMQVAENAIVYGFLNGLAVTGDEPSGNLSGGASGGLIFGVARAWRANLEAGVWQDVDGEHDTRPFGRAELRLGSSPRWDLRARFEWRREAGRDAGESRIALSRYW
ncbi:MAG: DUF4105 domain-containing protein [Pseudomonadota bacterium]